MVAKLSLKLGQLNMKFVGNLLVILSLVFLGVKFVDNIDSISLASFGAETLAACGLMVAVTAVAALFNTYSWMLLVRAQSKSLDYRRAFIIYNESAVAKYIPGNVFHYLGRLTLGLQCRLPGQVIVASMVAETLFALVAVGVMGLAALMLDFEGFRPLLSLLEAQSWKVVLVAAVCGLVLLFVVKFIYKGGHHPVRIAAPIIQRPAVIMVVIGLTVLSFGLIGTGIAYLVEAAWPVIQTPPWYRFAYGFAVAWAVGLLVPGAPGGIGVREVVLVAIFAGSMGEGVLIGLVLLLRVLMTLAELVLFAVGFGLHAVNQFKL